MTSLTPHPPQSRNLLWSDTILDLQDQILKLNIPSPLYIVGGAVRDAFLHRPIKDLDLATPGDAVKIARQIANALNGDFYLMDAERAVARVLLETPEGRLTIDVAAFRGDDLLADLKGRDFTINAMACDLHKDMNLLIDPLNGEKDGTQKLIRLCTSDSIAEDPIRGLRAVRHSVELGFHIEAATVKAIRQQSDHLMGTSAERVRDEFFKLIALRHAPAALRVTYALGLLQQIIPEVETLQDHSLAAPHVFDAWKHTLETIKKLSAIFSAIAYSRSDHTAASFGLGVLAMQLDRYRSQLNEHLSFLWPNDRPHTALINLGGLLHVLGRVVDSHNADQMSANMARKYADALRLSSAEKKRLAGMISIYTQAQTLDYRSDLMLHRFWYPLDRIGIDANILALADYLATYGNELDQDAWLQQVERAVMLFDTYYFRHQQIVSPPRLLDGKTLMQELNLQGGPLIGDLLTKIREGQVTGDISSRDQALQAAKTYLRDLPK